MNVAHVLRKYNPAEWGGTETALHRLCDGLQQGGVRSLVYSPSLPNLEGEGADPLAEVGCVMRRYQACVPIWGLPEEKRRQMVAVGGNLMSFELLRSLWREPGLSVIHSHTMGRIGSIGRVVARRRRLPFVFTTHGGVYDLPPALKAQFNAPQTEGLEWGKLCGFFLQSRRLLDDADAIITCNEREAQLMRRHHPSRRVVVQPHGVPSRLYEVDQRPAARAAFPRLSGRSVLLALGRIDAVKNQSWLIGQLPALIRRHPRLLLVLAGAVTDEGYAAELEREIARLGLGWHVILTGGLPPGDPRLIGLLQEARAVVLPSVSETFGLVILEAWAAHTAVIASRTTGATSLIEDGKNGVLFNLDAPEAFHAGIDRLWFDPDWAGRLASVGRQRVWADFDTRVLAERMRRLYENLIEEKLCAT
jgi:glycosyltransferase involved in cell wall biosynthesis